MKQKLFTASLTIACLLTINCSLEAETTKQKILEQRGHHVVAQPQVSSAVKVEPQAKPVVAKPQVNTANVTKSQAVAKPQTQTKAPAKQKGKAVSKAQNKTTSAASQSKTQSGKTYYRGQEIPANWKDISLTGEPVATKHQALTYLTQTNPKAKLDCTPEEIVNVYWVEAMNENIRPDLAFCQAIVETGFFKYGGDVLPSQNNFCGLGTVGGGAKGVRFKTPAEGARAHIQHLLAYSRVELPKTKIIDPRYKLVHGIRMERGLIHKWSGLNGTWAMGGNYCEKIMTHYQNMLKLPAGSKSQNKIDTNKKIQDKAPRKMREKAWNHIETK